MKRRMATETVMRLGLAIFMLTITSSLFVSPSHCQSSTAIRDSQGKPVLPEYVQEFFLSEAVRSQDKNELQITFTTSALNRLGNNTDIQLEYGLTNRLQLNFEMPYGITATPKAEIPAHWSSTSVGLRYQVTQSDRPFAFSMGMALGLPIDSKRELSYQPIVLAAKSFRRLQLHASFVTDVEKHESSFEYNVAGVYPMQHHWFPTMEFNGRRRDAQNGFYLTPGLYRHFSHRLELGFGVPVGLGGIAGPIGIVGKVNWESGVEGPRY
jgi:hypothetical protein